MVNTGRRRLRTAQRQSEPYRADQTEEAHEDGAEVERVRPGSPVVVREQLEEANGAGLVGVVGLDDEVARDDGEA